MRIAFLVICVVCATLASALVFTLTTREIAADKTGEQAKDAGKSVEPAIAGEINRPLRVHENAIEELIKSLEAEKKEMQEARAALATREEAIRLREDSFQAMKSEIESLRASLENRLVQATAEEQANLRRLAAEEQTNLRRLADVYAKMDPASASDLLIKIEREKAAAILSMISERSAAAILNAAMKQGGSNSDVAAEWSEIIRTLEPVKAQKKP